MTTLTSDAASGDGKAPRHRSRLIELAEQDFKAGQRTWRRIVVENGLSILIFSLFLLSWVGQILSGLRVYNDERLERGQPDVSLVQYIRSGHFVEATSENWESEFLQMAAFVWFTSFLYQRGSPESKEPYQQEDDAEPVTEESPWAARKRGWVLKIYEKSLSLTLFLLFVICFSLHAAGGARAYGEEQVARGQPPVTVGQYLRTSHFWFESFQNWQSEFLSIGTMIVLAIFLRQKGSPESKPVQAPHWKSE